MRKLILAGAAAAFALAGLAAAPGAQACDNGYNPNGSYQSNPGTGGVIITSTDAGNRGVTSQGPTGYIEAREYNGGYEVGGRHSSNLVYGQVDSNNPGAICVNDLP